MRKLILVIAILAVAACTTAEKREPAAFFSPGLQGDSPDQIIKVIKDWLKPGTHSGTSLYSKNPCVVHVLAGASTRYDVFVSETADAKDTGAAGVSIGPETGVLFHIFAANEPNQSLHIDRYNSSMSFHESLDLRRDADGVVSVRSQHLREDVVHDSSICVLSK